MYLRTALLTMFIFSSYFANAQKDREYILVLAPTPLVLPQRAFYIDSVIDTRLVKQNIGMAQVGMNNRQVEAKFAIPFENALLNYFRQVTPAQKDQQPMVAVVNELRISEKTYKMKERGMADVEITFCRLDSGRLLSLGTFHSAQESGGMDVTMTHPRRVMTALEECLAQFNQSAWLTRPGTPYTIEKEWVPSDDEHNILRCSKKKEGIYQKFTQLRSNSPQEETPVQIDQKGDLYMVRDSASNKKLVEAYGLSNGKDIFINTFFYNGSSRKGLFAKVMEEGRYMAWIDHYTSASESAAMGGAFGALGAAAARSGKDVIVLDLKTGVITPVNGKSIKKILSDDTDLLLQYQQAKSNGEPGVILAFIKTYNEKHPLR